MDMFSNMFQNFVQTQATANGAEPPAAADMGGGFQQPGQASQIQQHQQQQQQQQQPLPGQQAPQQQQQQPPQPAANPEDPLAKFTDLFNIPKEQQEADQLPENFFPLNPEEFDKVAAAQDFFQGAPAELVQQATSGDANSFVTLMNFGLRNLYKNNAQLSGRLADQSVRLGLEHVNKAMPKQVRSSTVTTELSKLNPGYSNPALQPVVQALQGVVERKYPNASGAELAALVDEFFQGTAGAVTGPLTKRNQEQQQQQQLPKGASQDFSNFF